MDSFRWAPPRASHSNQHQAMVDAFLQKLSSTVALLYKGAKRLKKYKLHEYPTHPTLLHSKCALIHPSPV